MNKSINNTRISVWSGPRNISTALMYAFAQRTDTKVVDEPLYAHYLAHSDAHQYHPGADDILATMDNDGNRVIQQMIQASEMPVYFYKNMTHHLVELDWDFLPHFKNVILTRDPLDMLPSFDQVIPNPSLEDVGYAMHGKLIDKMEEIGLEPIILDSKRVLENPERCLKKLCEKLDVPFDYNMLQWEKGARPEDGIWAPYWYRSVHESTGFLPYKAKENTFPVHLKPLLHECQKYYQQLLSMAI